VTQLATNGLFTAQVGAPDGALGAGYAIACAVTTAVSITLLQRRMPGLLARTFQSQPYATEA
jgi:hypothetical protein